MDRHRRSRGREASAALAVLALAEPVTPHGSHLRVPLGVGLLAAGLWRLAAASGLA